MDIFLSLPVCQSFINEFVPNQVAGGNQLVDGRGWIRLPA